MQAALPKLCALAAALDQSPPLELAADGAATAAARLLPREWMKERLEEHLQQAVRGMLLLPEGKISSPVVVAGQIADLSAALALVSHHAGIDLRAALDITIGREFGALSESGALHDGGEGDGGGGGAGRVRAAGLPAQGGAPAGGVKPYLLDALKLWLRTSVDELAGGALTPRANGGGATYLHSRRAFSPGLLCRTQMAALAKAAPAAPACGPTATQSLLGAFLGCPPVGRRPHRRAGSQRRPRHARHVARGEQVEPSRTLLSDPFRTRPVQARRTRRICGRRCSSTASGCSAPRRSSTRRAPSLPPTGWSRWRASPAACTGLASSSPRGRSCSRGRATRGPRLRASRQFT